MWGYTSNYSITVQTGLEGWTNIHKVIQDFYINRLLSQIDIKCLNKLTLL